MSARSVRLPCQVSWQFVEIKLQPSVHGLGAEATVAAAAPVGATSAAQASTPQETPAAARITAAKMPSFGMRASPAQYARLYVGTKLAANTESAPYAATPENSDPRGSRATVISRSQRVPHGDNRIGRCSWLMRDVCSLICLALVGLFRSRASLQAEILTLRHQLNVLQRKSPQRLTFTSIDRLVFAGLYPLARGVLDALKIVGPETVIRCIAPASEHIGAGNQDRAVAVQRPRWRSASSFVRSVSPTHYGAHGFMASFSSSASMSDKPPLQSMWRGEGDRRPGGGRHSFIITPTASRRWTCSWFRQSHSDCSTGC
jgi:hypothetical protein